MRKAATGATPGVLSNVGGLDVPVKKIGASMVDSKSNDMELSAKRAFHRASVSAPLFPSDKFADSVATGCHTTDPFPRTTVNDLLIWSQSMCRALSSGTPMRVRRVTLRGITPSYPTV